MVKYNFENGGNFMAEFFQNCWGYQIWTCGFMWFQVGEQFLDAGGIYIVMFGIEGWGLGPLSGRGPGVSFVKTEEN